MLTVVLVLTYIELLIESWVSLLQKVEVRSSQDGGIRGDSGVSEKWDGIKNYKLVVIK